MSGYNQGTLLIQLRSPRKTYIYADSGNVNGYKQRPVEKNWFMTDYMPSLFFR